MGSHLADALVKQGARVFIVDNLSTGLKENINPRAKFYNLDMNSPEIDNVFKKEKPEIIYHLAFNTNVPKSVEDPMFDAGSITGSLNIFNNAVKYGVKKIIMASSAFVYGNYPSRMLPVTEEHESQPVSPYVVSKLTAENYLRYFNKTYGISCVILRYATTYGPRQVRGAMADYIRKIDSGLAVEMFGDGNITRDYIYVEDNIKANIVALGLETKGNVPVINLGSAKETTLNELHSKIAKLLKKPDAKPAYYNSRPGEILRFCVSNKKAKKELGWQPEVSLDEGLKRTVAYFLRMKKRG